MISLYSIQQSKYEPKTSMFFINRNLKTQLMFSHYNMDRLQNDEEIFKKLKEKVQGRCLQEYGYILQVSKNPNAKSNSGIDIATPQVQQNGCTVTVTFSAISFKPQKNDIIDILVSQITQGFIKGKIGHASVLIPRARMPQNDYEYRSNQNIYLFRQQLKIDKQSKLRCKVVEIEIDFNYQMLIIAAIDQNIITSMLD